MELPLCVKPVSEFYTMSAIDQGEGTVRDAHEENLLLLIRRNFINDPLTLEMLAVHSLDDSDGVAPLYVAYQLTSNTTLAWMQTYFAEQRMVCWGGSMNEIEMRLVVSPWLPPYPPAMRSRKRRMPRNQRS